MGYQLQITSLQVRMRWQSSICLLLSTFLVCTVSRPQSAIDYAAQFSALNYFTTTTTTTTTTTPAPNQTSTELSGPLTLGTLLEPYSAVNIANPYSALSYVQNISAVAVANSFRARITTTTTTQQQQLLLLIQPLPQMIENSLSKNYAKGCK